MRQHVVELLGSKGCPTCRSNALDPACWRELVGPRVKLFDVYLVASWLLAETHVVLVLMLGRNLIRIVHVLIRSRLVLLRSRLFLLIGVANVLILVNREVNMRVDLPVSLELGSSRLLHRCLVLLLGLLLWGFLTLGSYRRLFLNYGRVDLDPGRLFETNLFCNGPRAVCRHDGVALCVSHGLDLGVGGLGPMHGSRLPRKLRLSGAFLEPVLEGVRVDLLVLREVAAALGVHVVAQHVLSVDVPSDDGIYIALAIGVEGWLAEVGSERRVCKPAGRTLVVLSRRIYVS